MNISDNGSDRSKPRENLNPVSSTGGSFLATISEILKLVVCIEIEKDVFMEIGCYLYRASALVKELQMNRNTPLDVIEIMQTMSSSLEMAKGLIVQMLTNPQLSSEIQNIIKQIEGVIKNMGDKLRIIPASSFGDQDYAVRVSRALSEEMRDVSLIVRSGQDSEVKKQRSVVLQMESKQKHRGFRQMDFKRDERKPTDVDLYPTDIEVASANLQFSDISQSQTYKSETQVSSSVVDRNDSRNLSIGSSLMTMPQFAQYMEPLYDTFFCPLSNKVMEDPVTIQSGVTYDRKEISEWFDQHEDSEDIDSPKSGQKLTSKTMTPNAALKATIDEWKVRNEAAKIKVARSALSLASSNEMVLEALNDLQTVCKNKANNKVQVRNIGVIPLLSNCMQNRNRSIRCMTIELLKQLAEDDEEGKEYITETIDISIIIKMLRSGYKPIRHASVQLLLELSRSRFLCNKIGTLPGGLLLLITEKYRQSSDSFVSEKAGEILRNLESLPENIRIMAENGYWDPLLSHLVEGNEERRIEMANCLAETVLGPDSRTYVTETASPSLIQMVHVGNTSSRNAALKALKQISCFHPNASILVEAGIMQIMVEEILARTIHNEPLDSKTEASAVLANILESGLELENIQVSTHGHTMASDYIVYNIVTGIKNSTPDELNINLIRILLCLMKFNNASSTVASVARESDASYNLVEQINSPNDELGIASIKLLITLSASFGHTLSDRLCKTRGLPESLIKNPDEITIITEKHAVSANFLAKLPHQNLTLNLYLVNNNVISTVMRSISQIQRTGTRSGMHTSSYFDGLVGILVRLTTTLYDHQILLTARGHDLASLFTELLTRSFSDEVQKLSAIGLENLSRRSVNLSKPPQRKSTNFLKFSYFHRCMFTKSSQVDDFKFCPVHRGVCSAQDTFCLLDAQAVDPLLVCMDHRDVEVIQAALSALSTLLDNGVNIDNSVLFLSEKHIIHHLVNVVTNHKAEVLWQKGFSMIEKILTVEGSNSIAGLSENRVFHATLVSAFHYGDDGTKQMAGRILNHLNKIPNLSHTVTFTM